MLLKRGSKGQEVKKLQAKLGLDDDGIFGAGTELSVKEWQKNNGLVSDGIVGNETWKKMFTEEPVHVVETINHNSSPSDFDALIGIIPKDVLLQLPETCKIFNLNSPLRIAHFLSQCSHESGGFKFVRENLNYSAEGLVKYFSKYFNETTAKQYAKNPEKIASKVYANRMGNGDENSGDGYKYRGRGYLQITGKSNYKDFGNAIEVDLLSDPDLVASKYPLLSASWFFETNGLIKMSDKGSSVDVIKLITKRVNGGFNGLDDRIKQFDRIYGRIK